MAEHQQGKLGSFTARYNVTRLVYCERFGGIRAAIACDKGIKRMLRAQKITLIDSLNPAVAGFERSVKQGRKSGILRVPRVE